MRHFGPFFLGLLLITAACGTRQSTGVSVSRTARRMIPPDARALAGIDIASLKNTEFYKREGKRLNMPLLDSTEERLGLDPRRDLSNAVIAWDGKKYLLIVEGRFSPAELERRLTAAGAHETPYRKYKLVGDIVNAVAVLNEGVIAAGPLAALEPAIDRFEDSRGGVPESLHQQLDKVPKTDQAWLVSTGGLPFVEIRMRSDIQSALSNIVDYVNAMSAGIRVDSGLHLQAEIGCISDQGAKRVHDALRGVIAFGRLSTKDNETELLRVYDAIHVNQKQQAVAVSADFAGELTDALLNRILGESATGSRLKAGN
ncbi:MAG TPA: hypothetical protein VH601_01070 [Bryobacteraceae bacterium]